MYFNSLWVATAPNAPQFSPLREDDSSEVAIIGGGIQGLSTALALAEAGVSVTLLEAQQPGAGASGRNGGQVIPGLKDDPDVLDRIWGPQATAFAGATADVLFDLVERLRLDCDATRSGWIQAGRAAAHLPLLRKRMEQWQARGAAVEWLDRDAMQAQTGSRVFCGGWLDRRAGKLHPLRFSQALAQAAQAAGARICGESPVAALMPDGEGWRVTVENGANLRARQVVLATNAYTPLRLQPDLARACVPAHSFQIATAPLSQGGILPGGMAVSEARRVGTYFRIGPQNRLLIGGRGGFGDPRGPQDFAPLVRELEQIFETPLPAIEYHWYGRVAMTQDHRLRLASPAPGLFLATGFNGRGVALACALGQVLGAHLARGSALPLPLDTRIRPMAFHGLHRFWAGAAIEYYRLRDWLER